MHKAMNGHLPMSLRRYLTTDNAFLYFKNPRLKQTKKSISFAGATTWQNFPSNYILESDFQKFKTQLKQNILNE